MAYAGRAATYGRQRGDSAELLATVLLGAIEAVTFRALAEQAWPTDLATEWLTHFFLGGIMAVETEHQAITDAFDDQVECTRDGAGS